LSLAVHLPSDRFDVYVCTTRIGGGPPIAELEAAGARHVGLGRKGRFDVPGHLALLRLARELRPDVLHAHMFGSNLAGSVFGRLARVPVVIAHEHTWSYEGDPVRKLLDGYLIGRLADAFLAVSSADAERMHSIEHVPRGKIRMIPNAWMPRPDAGSGDLRTQLGLGPDVPIAVSVTTMRPQKRLDLLAEAFVRTLRTVPGARLLLVGDGPERPALEAAVDRLGLRDAVHFLGYRQDIDAVFAAADAMVLSSDFEGTPIAVLEAMAAGVPVISTNVGGLPDVVDQTLGVLVPRRDAAALGDAMALVLGDRDLAARMGAAARKRAAEFTVDRYTERCGALYEELLAASRRRR